MRLSREALSTLCAQHSVPQETDKLIMRFCVSLRSNHAQTAQVLVHLKQYTLWLHAEQLNLTDTTIDLLTTYAGKLNECFFTTARKSMRILNIVKFLAWCKLNKYINYDETGMPLSKDDLLSRPVFSWEPTDIPHELYKHAADAYVFNSCERGYALLRVSGVTYQELTQIKVQDVNLASRLRISLPPHLVHTPSFQDREDIIRFLNHESKLNLTDPLPPHLLGRALIDRIGVGVSIAAGKYETLIRLLGKYATTTDPRLVEFIEIHFPATQNTKRYKNCKSLNVNKEVLTALGHVTSSMIVAMYRERLPW